MDKKNIEELLGNYMVVPEIQREYVWGSNKNIVNQFIDSIIDNKDINVGFLYSYSNLNRQTYFAFIFSITHRLLP